MMVASILLASLLQSRPVQIATGPLAATADQPQIAVSPSGDVYVAFGSPGKLYVCKSTDDGYTFSAPVALPLPTEPAFEGGGVPLKSPLGMRRGPRIAASKSRVVVTAVYGAQGGGKDGDLLAWRSEDDGKTWKGPEEVNDVAGSAREGLHTMGVNGEGTFVAAWLDLRGKGTQIVSCYSTNGGRSWSKNVLVYASPDGSVCECCHPSLAFGPFNECALMFRNSLRGMRDMWVSVSPDGGRSWDPGATKIGTQSWEINACPMDGGSATFDSGGGIASVWRSQEKLYYARGGASIELAVGRNPWMAWSGNAPVFVWETGRGGSVYFQSGTSPTNRKRLTESGSDPVVATTKTSTIAAWHGAGANPGIFVQRM